MNAIYMRHILDEYMTGWGVAYPTMRGICISTPFINKIQSILLNQPEGQFITNATTTGELLVSLSPDIPIVCKACGSPHFITKIIEECKAYIDPKFLKARTIKLRSRSTAVECAHCKELTKIKVHRHPEIKKCT